MPARSARSVCLVTLSLSEAGPGRFGRQVSVTDIYHTILRESTIIARTPWLQPLRGCGATLPVGQDRWLESTHLSLSACLHFLSRIDVTRRLGYNYFPAVVPTTGKWIKRGSVSAHTSGYIREAGCVLLNP